MMKDPRISIRLTAEEHKKFKMIAVKKNTNMQKLLIDFVKKQIAKEENSNGKNN